MRRGCSATALPDRSDRRNNAVGIAHEVVPISNDPIRTVVQSEQDLAFQHYFVRSAAASGQRFSF